MAKNAISLFSGGLDSILAVKLLQEQGLEVVCVHFTSPFFGDSSKIDYWSKLYDLNIVAIDVSVEFADLLLRGPEHGFGKTMNPCVDCKILQLRLAKQLMPQFDALLLSTGEVIGQRPMSQRRDALHLIQNKAQVNGILLRPLCALHLPPTEAENSGLVDRSRLLGISGRGRVEQLELAQKYALPEIPAPAGGCRLTEKENSRRYWQVLKMATQEKLDARETAHELHLANFGRQLWRQSQEKLFRLCVGRNADDNAGLLNLKQPGDITLKLAEHTGPLALARKGANWPRDLLEEAAKVMTSFAPKVAACQEKLKVRARGEGKDIIFNVKADRLEHLWNLQDWEKTKAEIRRKFSPLSK